MPKSEKKYYYIFLILLDLNFITDSNLEIKVRLSKTIMGNVFSKLQIFIFPLEVEIPILNAKGIKEDLYLRKIKKSRRGLHWLK
ncbi:hypothetical protein CH380_20990 [Leptospira adleri]|uniref:Uncharacterized protein n=1 Tax=Leptospira adleri TaxID=2023186 RepID=A0A2M9YIA9_9LEPT|nr:hypothetical protein CH380_20990 [Leptospira adleri]PJZ60101.1 hypothetical protein CH376_20165 [Leptospira adleri]